MLDAGLTVALSSDAPVVENDNPLAGMTAAILRRDRSGELLLPAQGITAAEALDAYTRGGAVAVGLEHRLGTLQRGAWADIAVLSGNPLTTPPEALADLSVEMTLLAGQVVYER
ncbi:MAG: amidohydrolase family protein [Vicinamibacterales bacterium]